MRENKFLIFIFVFLFINLVSANGIVILNDTFNFNKTYNVDREIIFDIRNDEPFPFYNISFEDQNIISMPILSELLSGETKTITAKAIGNEDFNGYIKIKGYHSAQIGASEEEYFIDIHFIDGLSFCSKTLIEGDKITWTNLVNDEVVIKNMVTGNEALRIPINSSETSNFDVPEIFTYAVLRRGYQFTQTCTITVLDDTGLVYDPQYSVNLEINMKIIYNPTQIQTNVLQRNYTMDFYGVEEAFISIKNIGNESAENINLNGRWFTDFNYNNFDLTPGETKNILFNIKPIIFSTNETDKTHIENLSISGNFPTMYENFSIYINYAEVGDDIGSNVSTLIDLICRYNPELCEIKERIIYRDSANGSQEFNVTFERGQVKGIWGFLFELGDQLGLDMNFLKEKADEDNLRITNLELLVYNLTNATQEERELREKQGSTIYIWITILLSIGIIVLMILWIIFAKRSKMRGQLDRM